MSRVKHIGQIVEIDLGDGRIEFINFDKVERLSIEQHPETPECEDMFGQIVEAIPVQISLDVFTDGGNNHTFFSDLPLDNIKGQINEGLKGDYYGLD